jgi:hypothetical protein
MARERAQEKISSGREEFKRDDESDWNLGYFCVH